jgi:hypothetical protein
VALAEHRVRLPDPGGRAKVDAEAAGLLDDLGGVVFHRRGLGHALVGAFGGDDTGLLGDLDRLLASGGLVTSFWHRTASAAPCCARTHNEGMTVAEGILLALSVAVFAYLGIAMFKPDWF